MTKLRRICNNCKESHRCPAGNGRYRIAEDCLFYTEKEQPASHPGGLREEENAFKGLLAVDGKPQPPPDPLRDEFEEAVKEFYLALAETSPGRTALWILEQAGHGLSKRRGYREAKAAHEARKPTQWVSSISDKEDKTMDTPKRYKVKCTGCGIDLWATKSVLQESFGLDDAGRGTCPLCDTFFKLIFDSEEGTMRAEDINPRRADPGAIREAEAEE